MTEEGSEFADEYKGGEAKVMRRKTLEPLTYEGYGMLLARKIAIMKLWYADCRWTLRISHTECIRRSRDEYPVSKAH